MAISDSASKKYFFISAGAIVAYVIFKIIQANKNAPKLEAPGAEPPKSWFLKHVPWFASRGGFYSKEHADLIEEYFEEQNHKSFWTIIPFRRATLNTVAPEVIEDIYADHERWTKDPFLIEQVKDFLGDGIFNANGNKWRMQRMQALPMFSERNMRDVMLPCMVSDTERLIRELSSLKPQTPYDLQKAFGEVIFDSFCKMALGWNVNTFETDSPYGDNFDQICFVIMDRVLNPFWKTIRWLGIFYEKELQERLRVHKAIIRKYVAVAMKKKPGGSTDKAENLVDLLRGISTKKGKTLDPETLLDFVSNFLLAGRNATATVMTFAIYHLLTYPHTTAKILEDIKQARATHPSDLRAQLKAMVYLEAWLWESMRFCTPVPTMSLCNRGENCRMKDGSLVPHNHEVLIRIQACSWNPKIWKDPKEFRPERHLKDGNIDIKPPHEFPVFNGGKRICMGRKMALMNAKLLMSELLTRFEFSFCTEKPAVKRAWGITVKSLTGLWVNVKKIEDK